MAKTLSQSQFVSAVADMGPGYASLLLGAGASRSSGVLLAREIVHDIASKEYCHVNGIPADLRSRVPATDVRSWMELQDWYRAARAAGESDYSAVFRQFKPTRDHQIRYIESILTPATASQAYHALCHLIREKYFPVLLTTNFDPLLENCYRGKFESEASLRTIESPEAFAKVTVDGDRNILGHLHGNLNGYDIANLSEDTLLLKPDIKTAAKRLLNPFALVVIGYSGQDESVMSLLEHLADHEPSAFKRGVVYWCHRLGGENSPRVSALLEKVDQGFAVPIAGFDQVIHDFCERVDVGRKEFRRERKPALDEARRSDVTSALNVAMVDSFPAKLYHFRTGLKSRKELDPFRDDQAWWQATVHDRELWLLGDPAELPDELKEHISAKPEDIDLHTDALLDENTWRIFSELANKGLATTLEHDHNLRRFRGNRFFFAKPKNKDKRIIQYMCRKRRTPRRVVWLEFERGTDDNKTSYFCHEAMRPFITRFHGHAALVVAPTRLFTVFGEDVWDTDTARSSVGRSTGKVWNQSYDSLVRLWLDVLSRERDTVNIRFSADGRRPEYRLQFSNRPLIAHQVEA